MTSLIFLKLGGSLITDKASPHTARPAAIDRLSAEIATAWKAQPGLQLVLGHGSGSYGHVPAHIFRTRQGVSTSQEWQGYAEVWHEARLLNQIVIESLYNAHLPVIAFPPSANAITSSGKVEQWDLSALKVALERNLVPVVYGDVVFDQARGGTILSTEDIFVHLAHHFSPEMILLAGIETGVWADYPNCNRLLGTITPVDRPRIANDIKGSAAIDVTGGMAEKVSQMLDLVQAFPRLRVMIFSGETPGQVEQALRGASYGTTIMA